MPDHADGSPDGRDGPPLVVVCGLPGVGKSRVARALGDCLPASVFRTDEVRKDLYDAPAYSDAETERVYAETLDRALAAVEAGDRAVLDGTYRNDAFREDVVSAAERLDVDPAFVKVECPASVVRERLAGRTDDVSDADMETYHKIRDLFDPLSRPHVTVDNSGDWDRTRDQLREAFGCEG